MENGKLKVESGIPMPSSRGDLHPLCKAMSEMKVGDSFLFPLSKRTNLGEYAKRAKISIATRTADAENCRVWRTA